MNLEAYAFPSVGNAPDVPGEYEYWNPFSDGASIAPGDVWVVCHPSADATILEECDQEFTFLSNGDDGYALVYGVEPSSPVLPGSEYIILDWLGDWNGDPGSGWSVAGVSNGTKDHTLVRKCSVTQGNINWDSVAGTNENDSEWIVYSEDTWIYLGARSCGCTDSLACNYDPLAMIDDSTCLLNYGCMDPNALNYNENANVLFCKRRTSGIAQISFL